MPPVAYAILLSLLPIAELRGGIPFAIWNAHLSPLSAYLICCAANILVYPIVMLFLRFVHRHLEHFKLYKDMFDKVVERTRRKTHDQIEKFGFWGLMIFVMIPLPVTGAYTGSLAAWIFGLSPKKSFLAVSLGVLIAGVIVTIVVITGSHTFDFLIKKVSV